MRISVLVLIIFLSGCSGTKSKTFKVYHAGFTSIHLIDKSRIYKQNTDTTDNLHYRPIDIDMWYPAYNSVEDTAIKVRELLGLLEQRANYYSASNAANGITAQLAQFFCDGFKCSDSTRLLRFTTESLKNAAAARGKFPLVVYMTAYNGMSYENFRLFEALAKKGFVVISISSIGRFPGDMTMKKADLMEQVNDAVTALNALKQNPNIDFTNIGIVGYSWGGLAGTILASRTPNTKCIVSLEGSEFHHYGKVQSENEDFNTIKTSKDFQNIQLSIPYLRLESAPSKLEDNADSVYNFTANHVSNAQIFTINSAQHEDFDCFSLVVREAGNCKVDQRYKSALKLTVGFLEDHLKNQGLFPDIVDQEINSTITRK